MADVPHFPMSQQTRMRLKQLLDESSSLGLDPEAVAAGGPVALRALLALKKANESEPGARRDGYLSQVQDALRVLQHRNHPELTQQLQARLLALQGRGSDTEIAHVARGEIVLPRELQTAEVIAAIGKAAEPYGVPIEMLKVGNALNHINPETGAPEFGVMDWISGLFGKSDNASTPSNPATPPTEPPIKIIQAPYGPDDPKYAEDVEAVTEHFREFPSESHPILGAVNKIVEPINKWLQERRPQRPPAPGRGGVRG
jgi:hypothetical protein